MDEHLHASAPATSDRWPLITFVCRTLGACAAMTDDALSLSWYAGLRAAPALGAQLLTVIGAEDHAAVRDLLALLPRAPQRHRTAPSGTTYHVYDDRRGALGGIFWYWNPADRHEPGADPGAGAGADAEVELDEPSPADGPESLDGDAGAMLGRLSERERDVVGAVLAGSRVSTIARRLAVSPSTVRSHLSSAFKKLRVSSQGELIERFRAGRDG